MSVWKRVLRLELRGVGGTHKDTICKAEKVRVNPVVPLNSENLPTESAMA